MWQRQVPLKVSIFAWRPFRDRLPRKANLVAGGIIPPDAYYCMTGCGGVESARHLFISCDTFGSLWTLVRSWISFSLADPHHLSYHFIQFIYSTCVLNARRSFLQCIWLLCVQVVLNERNNRLFKNTENSIPQLLDKVKLYSFWWMKVENVNFVLGYHSWWSCPFTCLSID